ncbi:diacylglycerol kinase [Cohnella laeviribosi]|uniref:diacylglycerol kinase n=1 Tax=Cohnella laeviribosi TaxID=380174 RepID=UPI000524932E|nr:MAG: diacylglycerol kinase [Cohnella sp.]
MQKRGSKLTYKRARLIYNPTSGREEMRRRLPSILQRLEQGGIETSCHATESRGDAVTAASEAVERGFDIVISAGGDGTLNEVVNGLCRHEKRPSLGILPMGTSNDFARAHGIPRRWEDAVDVIIRGHERPVDIGLAGGNFFINIAGGGFLTEISYEVPSKLKTMIGHMAYYIKGFESITRFRPTRLRIRAEGIEDMEGDYMLFLIANSHTVAGFDKLAPRAATDDGLFDVIIMKKCNLAEMIRLATLALRGDHISDSHIIHFQTNRIQVESEDRVQLNLDGELGGELPCSFTMLPSHLSVLVGEEKGPERQG